MIHSDRGGIYGGAEYLDKIAEIGIKRSMSPTSNPWDNAVIESFFSTLHFKLLSRTRFENQDDAQQSINHRVDRQLLQLATEAYDDRKHKPNQLRIGLPSAQAEDIINLSTKVEQAHNNMSNETQWVVKYKLPGDQVRTPREIIVTATSQADAKKVGQAMIPDAIILGGPQQLR